MAKDFRISQIASKVRDDYLAKNIPPGREISWPEFDILLNAAMEEFGAGRGLFWACKAEAQRRLSTALANPSKKRLRVKRVGIIGPTYELPNNPRRFRANDRD